MFDPLRDSLITRCCVLKLAGMDDAVPAPAAPEHLDHAARQGTPQRAPMLIVEIEHLLSDDVEAGKERRCFFFVVHLRVGVVGSVGVAAEPFLVAHPGGALRERAMALELVARETDSCEQVYAAGKAQELHGELAQEPYLDRVVNRPAAVDHGEHFAAWLEHAPDLAH